MCRINEMQDISEGEESEYDEASQSQSLRRGQGQYRCQGQRRQDPLENCRVYHGCSENDTSVLQIGKFNSRRQLPRQLCEQPISAEKHLYSNQVHDCQLLPTVRCSMVTNDSDKHSQDADAGTAIKL